MPIGLKASRPIIANMILFANISDFFYTMPFRVAHWDTEDGSFVFQYPMVRLFNILLTSVTCLHYS